MPVERPFNRAVSGDLSGIDFPRARQHHIVRNEEGTMIDMINHGEAGFRMASSLAEKVGGRVDFVLAGKSYDMDGAKILHGERTGTPNDGAEHLGSYNREEPNGKKYTTVSDFSTEAEDSTRALEHYPLPIPPAPAPAEEAKK